MATVADVLRLRRRRRSGAAGQKAALTLLLGVCATAILAAGAAAVGLGRAVFAAAAGLPDASSLAGLFGAAGDENLRPTLLFDRSGEVLLAELGHPLAAERRWQSLERLPPYVSQAIVAVLEPGFWGASHRPEQSLLVLLRSVGGSNDASGSTSIAQRLGEQSLLPAEASETASLLLAADIDATFPRATILGWFLNSADFGNLAFGIDAAALVYFGKHAEHLTVGEAAMLAAILGSEGVDPFADAGSAHRLREDGLGAMLREGWLSAEAAVAARREPLDLQGETARDSIESIGFMAAVWNELASRFGPGLAAQGGARVVTTLDLDLQLQADCVVRSHLARLAGQPPTTVANAADGSPCVAASFLPPVRPGDVGVDHGAGRGGLLVLDPTTGEVLALVGSGEEARASGGAAEPFVYLSALARGFTPATMLVVPAEDASSGGEAELMRLRTALTGGSTAAAGAVIELIGAESAAQTLDRLGLKVSAADSGSLAAGEIPVRMIDLAGAYGALANRGVQIGASALGWNGGVGPILIREVHGPDGRVSAGGRIEGRAVISDGLAYLMTHMLADEPARWPRLGAGNLLEIGRPAAATIGDAAATTDNWTVGYTPQRVVVSWVGAERSEALTGVHGQNGAAPIWHAVMRYAHRSLAAQDWERPADVNAAEVCDPSGYLATPYCPDVVREVFLAGTEPTHADTFYRPFRVNRETGRLATYFTPIDLVEERVYFVPPPEAVAVLGEGVDRPPAEYDRIPAPAVDPTVHLRTPEFFEIVSGIVTVRGTAAGSAFDSFRLDSGSGLDPRAWLQIGDETTSPVNDGTLGQWDTAGLNGVHLLRLTVVRQDGTVETAAVTVTVDNTAPRVELVLPADGLAVVAEESKEVVIEAEVSDETGLEKVVLYLDGRVIATRTEAPWSTRWAVGAAGEHVIRARAYDLAGNSTDSDEVRIRVER